MWPTVTTRARDSLIPEPRTILTSPNSELTEANAESKGITFTITCPIHNSCGSLCIWQYQFKTLHVYNIMIFIHVSFPTFPYFHQPLRIQIQRRLITTHVSKYYIPKLSPKELLKMFLIYFVLRYPYQMLPRPPHSIIPPGGIVADSSALAGAAAWPALAIGLVMPSITLMNTTV